MSPKHGAPRRRSPIALYCFTIAFEGLLACVALEASLHVGLGGGGAYLADFRRKGEIARDLGLALLIVGACTVLTMTIRRIAGKDATRPKRIADPAGPLERSLFAVMAVSAAVCEEIAFRGFLQGWLISLTGSLVAGVLLQGVVFGIAHSYQGLHRVPTVALEGILLGAGAGYAKSLRPGILAHAAMDLEPAWTKVRKSRE